MLKKTLRLLGRKRTGQLFTLAVGMFFGALLETLGISMIVSVCTLLMDENMVADNWLLGRICAALGLAPGKPFVMALLAALLGLYLFKLVYLLGENYLLARYVRLFRHELSTELYEGVLRGPYARIVRDGASALGNLINADTTHVAYYLESLLQVISELLVAVTISVLLALINPLMTVAVLAGMGVCFLITRVLIRRRARRAGELRQRANQNRIKWLDQGVNGIKEIKVSQTEAFFCDRYRAASKGHVDADIHSTLLRSVPRLCIEAIMVACVLLYTLVLVAAEGDVRAFLPGMSALVLSALRLLPSFNRINSSVTQMSYCRASIDAVADAVETVRAQRAARPGTGGTRQVALTGQIEARDVTFRYDGRPEPVLKDVNMTVPVGSAVGVVGLSGAGKTTLVDILLGLLQPQQGEVRVDGVPLEQCRESYLEKVAYIPQTIFLMDDTVRSNVALGTPPEQIDDDAVWTALEKASLAETVRAMPAGLDTRVGEGGVRLSGGERQRVGIARALYRGSPLMIFDEATSALDVETEEQIIRSIRQLRGEKTVVIISHRHSAVEHCDRIYRVEGERVRLVQGVP